MNDKTKERAVWHTQKVRMPYAPAIEAMQAIVDLANDTITDPAYVIAAGMALDALKREAAEAVNDPLTLEELRGMDGEPVYAALIEPTVGKKAGYGLYYDDKSALTQRWTNWCLWYEDYGKTWLAYRRKPEGGGDDACRETH